MDEHSIVVSRTARFWTAGNVRNPACLWYVLHGYGHLAEYFLKNFDDLSSKKRLFVAPEALSRFYTRQGKDARVGASWMTREAREDEIADYVAYLDAVHKQVALGLTATPRVFVLGFSQGAATAARWSTLGSPHVEAMVLWGGGIPPDMNLEKYRATLKKMRTVLAVGTDDEYISEDQRHEELDRIAAAGLEYHLVIYEGGHELHTATLADIFSALEQ